MSRSQEIALCAFNILKRMLIDEYPSEDIIEIITLWGNADQAERLAVQEMERLSNLQ